MTRLNCYSQPSKAALTALILHAKMKFYAVDVAYQSPQFVSIKARPRMDWAEFFKSYVGFGLMVVGLFILTLRVERVEEEGEEED